MRKNRFRNRQAQVHLDTLTPATFFLKPDLSSIPIPFIIYNTPSGESDGTVLDVKTLSIRNVPAPYNSSIIEYGSGFLLFFRYDELHYNCKSAFESHIGCVELDENLNQTEKEFVKIKLENNFNEDPRAIWFKGDIYLIYNSLNTEDPKSESQRIMKVACLDPDTLKVKSEMPFDLKKQPIEKNWAPFIFKENDKEELFFEYYLTPRQLLKLETHEQKTFLSECMLREKLEIKNLTWPEIWGEPRGGTPACKIGDEYLGFFHSFFRSYNTFWYVMGAYTFEASFPFRITGISHYPIFFKGIFESEIRNTANPLMRCVFPSGFVIKKREGKEVIYLSAGENDSCTKIIILDKEALLKNLKRLNF